MLIAITELHVIFLHCIKNKNKRRGIEESNASIFLYFLHNQWIIIKLSESIGLVEFIE